MKASQQVENRRTAVASVECEDPFLPLRTQPTRPLHPWKTFNICIDSQYTVHHRHDMWLSFEVRVDRGKKEGEGGREWAAQVVSLTTVKDVEGVRRRGG